MYNKSLNEKLNDTKKIIRNFRGSSKDKCFFVDCSNTSIKSHSISESKVLSLLEGIDEKKSNVIYHLEDVPEVDFGDAKSISTYQQTHRKLFRKGKSETSTFYGFCSSCDNLIFELIDNRPYKNYSQINFLYTLRTQAHSIITSRNIFRHMSNKIISKLYEVDSSLAILSQDGDGAILKYLNQIPDDEIVNWENVSFLGDFLKERNTAPVKSFRDDSEKRTQELFREVLDERNFPMKGSEYKSLLTPVLFQFEKAVETYKKSPTTEIDGVLRYMLNIIDDQISDLTSKYRNKEYEAFEYLHVSVEGVYLIAGAFVYRYTEEKECTLIFFPEEETSKTQVIFAVEKGESKYLSFLNFKTNSEFQTYLSSIILSSGSNVFLSPKYWEKLSKETQSLMKANKTKFREFNINLFDKSLKE